MFEPVELSLIAEVMTTYYQSMKSGLDRSKSDPLLRSYYESKMNISQNILEHLYSKLRNA